MKAHPFFRRITGFISCGAEVKKCIRIETILSGSKKQGFMARETVLQSFTTDKMADGFIEVVDAVKRVPTFDDQIK